MRKSKKEAASEAFPRSKGTLTNHPAGDFTTKSGLARFRRPNGSFLAEQPRNYQGDIPRFGSMELAKSS